MYAAFIDLEKAYDKIPRDILLRKLNKLGINGNILNVLSSMYQGGRSCVKICNKRTEYFDVNRGLKQGCALSPNLFNIFISDLPGIFRQADSDPVKINNETIGSLFWADDILLISETAQGLQKSLKKLEDYC